MQLDFNDLLGRLLVSVDRVLIRITPHGRPHGVTPAGRWSLVPTKSLRGKCVGAILSGNGGYTSFNSCQVCGKSG